MNKEQISRVTHHCIANDISFGYSVHGELRMITIPHGVALGNIMKLFIGNDPLIPDRTIVSSDKGLIIK